MNISTTYLGLNLRSPLVVGACGPLTKNLSHLRQMEDAGAGAVVLHSLFEEQLQRDRLDLDYYFTRDRESHAKALTYVPQPTHSASSSEPHSAGSKLPDPLFSVGSTTYLDHVESAKQMVDIPIIASLNGSTPGGWTKYAQRLEDAGADAIELNLYAVPTDPSKTALQIEQAYCEIVRSVAHTVDIPIAVKLSPYFTSLANMAMKLNRSGADGLVLFNRFYQPTIDIEALEVASHVLLSSPQDLRLPLRWIAILYGTLPVDLAATSGVHQAKDAIAQLMAGASITQMTSALLRHGIGHISRVEQDLKAWLEAHEYESLEQLQGSMSQINCPDPSAFERSQYIKSIQTYEHYSDTYNRFKHG